VGIELVESSLPIHEEVRGACELLGLDPLYVASEGKLIAIVAPEAADAGLQTMRRHPLGGEARMIGTVKKENPGLVTMRTPFGTTRIVDMLAGDQLPRICRHCRREGLPRLVSHPARDAVGFAASRVSRRNYARDG